MNPSFKLPAIVAGTLAILVLLFYLQPFDFNEAGNRTVVTFTDGTQKVQFQPGIYYCGFFSRQNQYPNQMTVSYLDSMPENIGKVDKDNVLALGWVKVRFSDAVIGYAKGIVQVELPNTEKDMLEVHNNHRSPEGLLSKRILPYITECLNNTTQLMTSEIYYGGGKSTLSEDYQDQLQNGFYLTKMVSSTVYDTIERQQKALITSVKQVDASGHYKRKKSSLQQYAIRISDGKIVDIEPMESVKKMLEQKIASAQQAVISKQRRITAEQEALTARAQGEKDLISTEFEQKKAQTSVVVDAQTKVELERQNLERQKIARLAADNQAQTIKILADAESYKKRTIQQANGSLELKLANQLAIHQAYAEAIKSSNQPLVPSIIMGGSQSQTSPFNVTEAFQKLAAIDYAKNINGSKTK